MLTKGDETIDKPVQELKDWIEREDRMQKWVVYQVGCSPQGAQRRAEGQGAAKRPTGPPPVGKA